MKHFKLVFLMLYIFADSVMNHLVVTDLPDGIYHARLTFEETVMNTRFIVL